MFLGALNSVASFNGDSLTAEARNTLEGALRYFREAAPKHTADEEDSLFPRMRSMSDENVQAALSRIDELEKDHRSADPLHAEVEQLGQKWLKDGALTSDDAAAFRAAIERLVQMYSRHIQVEETAVFPAAAKALSATQKAEIAKEMASRRAVQIRT